MRNTTKVLVFSSIVFAATSLHAARPADKGGGNGGGGKGGGTEAVFFEPEIAFRKKTQKGDELRLANRDDSVELLVPTQDEGAVHGVALSSESAHLIAYATDEGGVFIRSWQSSPTEGVTIGDAVNIAPPAPHRIEHIHFSPDNSRIVYSTGHDVFTIGVDGSDFRDLDVEGYNAKWLPDGTIVAFARGSLGDGLLRLQDTEPSPVELILPSSKDGVENFSSALGMDVTGPASTVGGGQVLIALGYHPGGDSAQYATRLWTLDGKLAQLNGSPIAGQPVLDHLDYRFSCSGYYLIFNNGGYPNGDLYMRYISGPASVWKKKVAVNPKTVWMRREPCTE